MKLDQGDHGLEQVATLDIETTHYKPRQGEIVSIGVGVHERGTSGAHATYATFHRDGSGEAELVERAVQQLHEFNADGLVSYNGRNFDLSFIGDRLQILGQADTVSDLPRYVERQHVDLFEPRKARAEQINKSWPGLEECLESYGYPCPRTVWQGKPLDNTRFGEELGPTYLDALSTNDERHSSLADVIDHYLVTDLEANFAIYYSDIGESFTPHHLNNDLG